MVSGKKQAVGAVAPPPEEELTGRLGVSRAAWRALVSELGDAFGPVSARWSRAGAKYPWTFVVEGGGKKLAYLVPGEGSFAATVVMGEKAIGLALEAGAGEAVRAAIEGAKKYAEGRPVRLEVRRVGDVAEVVRLVRCKLEATGAARKVAAAPASGRPRGGARL